VVLRVAIYPWARFCIQIQIHGFYSRGGNICPVPSSRSHSTATCMKMIHFRTRMMRLPVRKPMFQGQCLAHDTIVKLPTRCCSAKPRRTVDPPVIRDLMRPYERPARRRRSHKKMWRRAVRSNHLGGIPLGLPGHRKP
jgi:hypothetical protein